MLQCAYEHLVKCSPCYREFRTFQQAGLSTGDAVGVPARWIAVAAVLVMLVGGAWYLMSRPQNAGRAATEAAQVSATDLRAELDLRTYSVTRSEQAQTPPPPLSLQRGRLNVTILLPVGSEPGGYEVQVLDSELRSRAKATGQAEIRDFVTTLQANLDISSLSPGAYQLAVRRHGDEWQHFPAAVK